MQDQRHQDDIMKLNQKLAQKDEMLKEKDREIARIKTISLKEESTAQI